MTSREESLLDYARSRSLTADEIDELVGMLLCGVGDPYTVLHALGRGSDHAMADVVEPYLDAQEDPMLARLAVQILCNYWERSADYLPVLRRFAMGVAWDEEGDVRQAAISALGEHVRREPHDTISLGLLWQIAGDADDDEMAREDALLAIARALGREWSEVPSATSPIQPESPEGLALLQEVTKRLGHAKQ